MNQLAASKDVERLRTEYYSRFSRVRIFVTLRTVALQALPSVGFSTQEYWSELPYPSPGNLPEPGMESKSPALQANSLPSEPPQFSSVAQSCLTLCNPMDCNTPGFPVHLKLLEPTQTHVYHIGDAIQPSHPLLSLSPPTFNLSQHRGLSSESARHIR